MALVLVSKFCLRFQFNIKLDKSRSIFIYFCMISTIILISVIGFKKKKSIYSRVKSADESKKRIFDIFLHIDQNVESI